MKFFLTLGFGMLVGVAAMAAPLDGTKWTVTVTPDAETAEAGEKGFEDELVFADGAMTSKACAAWGFKASVYLVTQNDEVLKWKTVQHSEVNGVANWVGAVEEAKLTGKLIWTKRDGSRLVFAFAGTRTQPAADVPKKE